MSRFVSYRVSEHVGTVVINRPDLHNAFNEVVIAELTDVFRSVGGAADARVVVLASEGKSFCAGADIRWMKRLVDYSFEENVADAGKMAEMLRTIRECPKPVIARVHGAAIGGGVGLVAACDIAVAVSSARFSLSEVKLGILPAVIAPFVLEKIAPGAARRYALTAEQFDAAEARRIGLISEVVEGSEALDEAIGRLCRALLANGPEAMAECKRVFGEVGASDWDPMQAMTVQSISERRVSAEGQEGLKAFLEKRTPRWSR